MFHTAGGLFQADKQEDFESLRLETVHKWMQNILTLKQKWIFF